MKQHTPTPWTSEKTYGVDREEDERAIMARGQRGREAKGRVAQMGSKVERGGFNVFHRTWWRRNPSWPDGREPGVGRKTYLARGVTEERAREICREYNAAHDPGVLSRKAEYESAA